MSTKAERKRRAEKAARKPIQPYQGPGLPPRLVYAEDIIEFAGDHHKHCSDPKCDELGVSLNPAGQKMVAMVFPHKLNEIFFALYGTNTKSNYRPFWSLQLANPGDIRACFDEDGIPECDGHCEHKGEPMCLSFSCHNQGCVLVAEPSNLKGEVDLSCKLGEVSIRCKACGAPLRNGGLPLSFQLASRPTPRIPEQIFCHHHGIQPAYLVCDHVWNGEQPPYRLEAASEKEAGIAICKNCYRTEPEGREKFLHMVCQSSLNLNSKGLLKELIEDSGQPFYVIPSTDANAPVTSLAVN